MHACTHTQTRTRACTRMCTHRERHASTRAHTCTRARRSLPSQPADRHAAAGPGIPGRRARKNPGRPGHHPSLPLRNAGRRGLSREQPRGPLTRGRLSGRGASCVAPGHKAQHRRGGPERGQAQAHTEGWGPVRGCWGRAGSSIQPGRRAEGQTQSPPHSSASTGLQTHRNLGSRTGTCGLGNSRPRAAPSPSPRRHRLHLR